MLQGQATTLKPAACRLCNHAHSLREGHKLIGGPAPSKAAVALAESVTVATGPMTREEAVALTERIRRTQDEWCRLVYEAHERQAWKAMGYRGWTEYVYAELPMSKSRAYQLLARAKIALAIGALEKSTPVDNITRGADTKLPTERQMRQLPAPARERIVQAASASTESARAQLAVEIAAAEDACAHLRRITRCEDCGRRL